MNVSDVKDINAQMLQQYQRSESITPPTVDKQDGSAAVKPVETVDLSTKARDIQQATVKVSQLPDVREEKVREIKDQVEKGTYNVSGEQIADKMMGETIVDLFA